MPGTSRGVLLLAALLLILLPTLPVSGGEHVRVILDTSRSMIENDTPRLAPLATVLLYDLAAPNPTLGDSFTVLPFHPRQQWRNAADPPPSATAPPIVAGRDRGPFVGQVLSLPYDGDWTYYHPGLSRAIGELSATPGGARDVRVIVLVTDGLPEAATRDAELSRIREELLPELEEHGIRFYVLAFGSQANTHRDFFDQLTRATEGQSLGELFVDADGSGLLTSMAEIFSRSFGYTHESVGTLLSVRDLDLEGGMKPDRVAVAVFTPTATLPSLALQAPHGGAAHAPDGVRGAVSDGAAYSLLWTLAPRPGRYALTTSDRVGQVAVLRPTRLELELRPIPPMKRIDHVMAEKPFDVELVVRPAGGVQVDPGEVEIAYQTFGPRDSSTSTDYAWRGERLAPARPGTKRPTERSFPLEVEFEPDPRQDAAPGEPYAGYLEVDTYRGEASVGSLRGPTAHRVEVYPFLAVHPVPLVADARPRGDRSTAAASLGRKEEGCARFTLDVDQGQLPHADDPNYALRAVVDGAIRLEGSLEGATFTLDGLPLQVDGVPGPEPGEWYKDRKLDRDRLLGEHVVCVRLGKPTVGNLERPAEVPIVLTLLETPYDAFGALGPFTLVVRVAPPTALERWGATILGGLFALLLLATLWHVRYRPDFPADLRVAVAREGSVPEVQVLPPPSQLARLFALRAARPIEVPGEDRRLGALAPVDEKLFRFRPARGAEVRADADRHQPARRGRDVEIAAGRDYRVVAGETTYRLRVGYER